MPESNQDHKAVYGSVDLVINGKYENGNEEIKGEIITGEDNCKQQKNNYKKDRNTEQQWNRDLRGGLNGVGRTGEKKETLLTKTEDRADRQEDNRGSAEDEGDDKNGETETRYKVVGQTIDGVEERGKTAAHTSETQIQDQTTTDRTMAKSSQQQVVDFMDTEPTQTISEASDFSQSISVTVMDTGFSHASKERGDLREEQFNSVDRQSVNTGPHPVIQEAQDPCCFEVETQDANLPKRIHQVPEEMTAEAQLCKKSAADFTTECPETLNESCTQKDTAALVTRPDVTVSIQEAENNMGPPGITSNVKQMNVTEEGLTQSISEQETLVTDANSSTYKKSQSNMATQENSNCQSVQDIMSATLEDMWASSIMNNVELESEVESSSFQAAMSDISTLQPFYEVFLLKMQQ